MKGLTFIPEMARAVCKKRKRQTRRVIVPQPLLCRSVSDHEFSIGGRDYICPYRPGERVCLLTTWAVAGYDHRKPSELTHITSPGQIWHAGMGEKPAPASGVGKSRPGRFLPNHLRPLMPQLEIVSVRAERVQDITEEDAEAEGIDDWSPLKEHRTDFCRMHGPRYDSEGVCVEPGWCDCGDHSLPEIFGLLWNTINQSRGFGWDANPWVWRVEFRRVDQ